VIRKLQAVCVFCGTTEDVGAHRGRGVCAKCKDELSKG
jgi:NMD protein affecting ribosome stability and mRNA decay